MTDNRLAAVFSCYGQHIKTIMEHQHHNETIEEIEQADGNRKSSFPFGSVMISLAIVILAGAIVYTKNAPLISAPRDIANGAVVQNIATDPIEQSVIPSGGIFIPVRWGDLGIKMVEAGVIDRNKFDAVYADRGGVSNDVEALLGQGSNDQLTITPENSGQILNLLWALGLANKNPILDNGAMQDPQYGGDPGRFASTGGWTLATGNAMDHYSKHAFVKRTSDQQKLVARVAQNIYRPCCGNSTIFPDCNHGMAMLGLLELMASQDVSEENMYRAALKVNSYWFPDTYITIARHHEQKGISWDAADPREVLGANYSSASGYRQVVSEMTVPAGTGIPRKSSGGCGV